MPRAARRKAARLLLNARRTGNVVAALRWQFWQHNYSTGTTATHQALYYLYNRYAL